MNEPSSSDRNILLFAPNKILQVNKETVGMVREHTG